MAPRATLAVPAPTVQPSSFSGPTPASHKPFVPVVLLVFLSLCLAYTFSFSVYRITKAHKRDSQEDTPDAPNRSVSQLMNGTRLTVDFGQNDKPTSLTSGELPDAPEEEKNPTDPSLPALPDIDTPTSSSSETSSSTPLATSPPSVAMYVDQDLGEPPVPEQAPTEIQTSDLDPPVAPAVPQPFGQRIAAKVKFLSRDRAEAIALDPKLAPVQVPLRPLSMAPHPVSRKRMTLFGLGLRLSRDRGLGSETDAEAR